MIKKKIERLPYKEKIEDRYGPLRPILMTFLEEHSREIETLDKKYHGEYFIYRHASRNQDYDVSSLIIEPFSKNNNTAHYNCISRNIAGRPINKKGIIYACDGKIFMIGHLKGTAMLELSILREEKSEDEISILYGLFMGFDYNSRQVSSRIALVKKNDINENDKEGVLSAEEISTNITSDDFETLLDNVINPHTVLKTPE